MLGVVNKDLDSHLHSIFVEVHIKTSDLCFLDGQGHTLGASHSIDSISVDKLTFHYGFSVAFEDVHGFDSVFGAFESVLFDVKDSVDYDFCE